MDKLDKEVAVMTTSCVQSSKNGLRMHGTAWTMFTKQMHCVQADTRVKNLHIEH